MITFLLMVALASSFITIQSSRPTQAESLLYTVGCIVKGLLTTSCPSNTQTNPPAEQTQPTPPPSNSNTNGTTTPSQSNGADSTTVTTQPIEMNQELLTKLPPIPEIDTQSFGTAGDKLVMPTTRGVTASSVGILGASDTAPIRPSSEGWRIVGAPWYWWVIAIGGVVGLYFAAKAFINRSFLGIVK